jgi:SAM-dependent methyltransferase
MDASMRQKVALTAAHLLCEGRVADMGVGSGTGSHALAALYPALEVVGVDISDTMVELARERFDLDNLSFVVGDIAAPVFDDASLDGIFDSSVLHHVTSFNGYDHEAAARCLTVQAEQLAEGGVLVVRDFLDPGEGEVLLDVRGDDGEDVDDPRLASTARLFTRFAEEFRILSDARGFEYAEVDGAPTGFRRFRLPLRLAVEFVLRKDYREDWESEVKEEYTYFTQARFEKVFAELGLRVLASTPIRNPWIVENRFADQIALRTPDGDPLPHPATNYVIVGERVAVGEGVRFRSGDEDADPSFLNLTCYEHLGDGSTRDLVHRPHRTLDVLPHFEVEGDPFVLARMSYPRPILGVLPHALDESHPPGYVSEPLNVLWTDKPEGRTVEEALVGLASIGSSQIRAFAPGTTYYPSPGGLEEEVRSVFVEVEPVFVEERIADLSGFSTSGRVRAIEARQLLRAAQVGGLPDARLELNVYDLLAKRGLDLGPWIGAELDVPDAPAPEEATTFEALLARPPRRAFRAIDVFRSPGFLQIRAQQFEELDARGQVIHSQVLEHVRPSALSLRTIATAPLRRAGDTVFLGVDDDDLPAAQCFSGNSQLLVAPAWRLPETAHDLPRALAWIQQRLEAEYGAMVGRAFELGGRYHPSAGITAEVVHPYAFTVLDERPAPRALRWVPLSEVPVASPQIRDGHLRIVGGRAHHALTPLRARRSAVAR